MQTQTQTQTTDFIHYIAVTPDGEEPRTLTAPKRAKRAKRANRKDVAAGRRYVDGKIDSDPRVDTTWVFLGRSGRTDWYQAYDCGVADTILIPLTARGYAGIGYDLRRGNTPNPIGDGIACADSGYDRPAGCPVSIWGEVSF